MISERKVKKGMAAKLLTAKNQRALPNAAIHILSHHHEQGPLM
jgi:hypothetical protein